MWRIHHKPTTVSTSLDARAGVAGDVFTADYQSAGRGRLDHRWSSPRGANLLLSAVVDVGALAPDVVATLPLVVGLAAVKTVESLLSHVDAVSRPRPRPPVSLKWPNDVWIDGRKVSGILCERHGDNVIVGIGINVLRQDFAAEIAARATTLAAAGYAGGVALVRDAFLDELARELALWRKGGFGAVYPEIAACDMLRGRMLSVRQTDGDEKPITGLCGGIRPDGALDVGGVAVYAGEAHVERLAPTCS